MMHGAYNIKFQRQILKYVLCSKDVSLNPLTNVKMWALCVLNSFFVYLKCLGYVANNYAMKGE